MAIKGLDDTMSVELINAELVKGAKFVVYQYCISVVVMTFKRSSSVHFVRSEDSAFNKGILYSLITLVFGWWGFPWGQYTPQHLCLPIFVVEKMLLRRSLRQ